MATDSLTAKIEQKAAEEAEALRADGARRAAARRDAILSGAQAQIDALRAQIDRRTADVDRRERLNAGLSARKNTLAAKRAVIDEAFSRALTTLCALSGAQWEELITRLIVANCPSGTVRLRVPAADREKYTASGDGKPLLDRLAESLGRPLALDTEAADCRGGALLIGEDVDVDLSFETLLASVRETQEREVAALLFGEDVR